MPSNCSVYGCRNRNQRGSNISFHLFPVKKPEILEQWILAVRREDFKVGTGSRICSEHFLESDFVVRPGADRRLLKENAVPSVFAEYPEGHQPPKRKRRSTTTPANSNIETTSTIEIEHYDPEETSVKEIRTRRRIKTLTWLATSLKKQGLIDAKVHDLLVDQFSKTPSRLFENVWQIEKRNPKDHRHFEDIKKVFLTLYYNAPDAYTYCRTIFHLPSPSTLYNWISNEEAEPGFLRNVFKKLEILSDDLKDCNLVMDTMSITKEINYDASYQKIIGFSDYGDGLSINGKDEPATKALFFMLVSLKNQWKCPIAYFLHNTSNALVQSNLIKSALNFSKEVGLRVHGITFDVTLSNLATAQYLGCKVFANFDTLRSNFEFEGENYHIIPDVSQLLILARNYLSDMGQFKSPRGKIEWRYITNLFIFQSELFIQFANKISKNHINWDKHEKKVKIAAQTLSTSTADALEFLQNQGHTEFKGAEETIKFIRNIDKLFDMYNSKIPSDKGFKSPIYPYNLQDIQAETSNIIKYLFSLRHFITNETLYPEKLFLIGFALASSSILKISNNLFASQHNFEFVPAHMFSLDHLELFFSKIRSRHEFNKNPNAVQLRSSVKYLLSQDILNPGASNCETSIGDPLGNIFEIKWLTEKSVPVENATDTEEDDEDYFMKEPTISVENSILEIDDEEDNSMKELTASIENEFLKDSHTDYVINEEEIGFTADSDENILKSNVLNYICGYIVKKIMPEIHCSTCKASLIREHREHAYAHVTKFSAFVDLKNRGDLICVSDDCLKIAKVAEEVLTRCTNSFTSLSQINEKLMHRMIMKVVDILREFTSFDLCDLEENSKCHQIELIKIVARYFLKIRLNALGKLYTDKI